MSSSLLFGHYLLLGRTHQSPIIDTYIAHSVTELDETLFYQLERLRSAARKGLPQAAQAFLAAADYLHNVESPLLPRVVSFGQIEGEIYWARPYVAARPLPQVLKKLADLLVVLLVHILLVRQHIKLQLMVIG